MNFKLLVGVLFILLQLQFLFAKEKFKYKGNLKERTSIIRKALYSLKSAGVIFEFYISVVKPKKKCVITYESTFSVTGFMTFVVVAMTSVANVIANINNNNDNNK